MAVDVSALQIRGSQASCFGALSKSASTCHLASSAHTPVALERETRALEKRLARGEPKDKDSLSFVPGGIGIGIEIPRASLAEPR